MTDPKKARLVLSAIVVASACFGYGVLVGAWRVFPYEALSTAWAIVAGDQETSSVDHTAVIETSLLELEATSYAGVEGEPSRRPGGGLTVLGDLALGVDRWGQFFVYFGRGELRELDIELVTNVDELKKKTVTMEELLQQDLNTADLVDFGLDVDDPSGYNLRSFRFMDLAAKEVGGQTHLFTSYYYWHPEKDCKSFRVARFVTDDFQDVVAGRRSVGAEEWEVIFESRPCLGFSYRNNSPFQSPNSGGRLLLLDTDRLLLSLGDHHLDGSSNPEMASQTDGPDYGKLIDIDLRTLSTNHLAKGLRNPQGLALDRYGRIWETEHGPRGGDELNLIRAGNNYGWPLVTFGTQYGTYEWERNREQGRHEGYTMPVYSWVPSIGISNLLEIRKLPAPWDGDLLVSSLDAGSLFRLRIENERVVMIEVIGIGERIRDMVQMRDGSILLWTDSSRLIELATRPQ